MNVFYYNLFSNKKLENVFFLFYWEKNTYFLQVDLNRYLSLLGAFEDEDVTHVEGEVDPVRDLDIIAEELRLKDEEMLMSNMEKLERTVLRGGDKKLKPEYVCWREEIIENWFFQKF